MTIPFSPSNEDPFPPDLGSMDGFLQGAALSALNGRTQANVTDMLQSQMQNNDIWGGLWELFWDFIRQPFDWLIDILKGLFPWIDWENLPTEFGNMLTWVLDAIHAIPFFGDFIQGAETFVQALIRNLIYWITHPGDIWDAIVTFLKDVFSHTGELIGTVINSIIYWLTHPGEPGGIGYLLIEGLKTLFTNGGAIISTIINSIIYWITHPGEPGGIGYLLIEALRTLFTNVGPLIETVINSVIYWITHPGDPGGIGYLLMEALKGLFLNGGALIETVINTLVYWMQNAGQFLSALIMAVINWLKTVGIDLTGGLSFIQLIVDNVAKFFGQTGETLWSWAQNIVNFDNLGTLIQGMFGSIFSIFPISMINTQEKVNLLNMGVFQSSSTLEAANGWSWDSSTNRTGASGGSAKLTIAGTTGVRTLYSNQNIRVAPGDRIAASAWIKTSSNFNSFPGIKLVLITFAGTSKVSEIDLVTSSPTVNQWLESSNASSPYEIPTNPSNQITSVQLALRVTADITSGNIWWDDITLWKTGLMKQGLVEYLISAWNGLIGGLGVQPNATPSAANKNDPWNWTLQAGADARSTANTAAANAGTAGDKADQAILDAGTAKDAADDATLAAGNAQDAADDAATAATNADNLASSAATANNLVLSPDFEDSTIPRTQYWLGVAYTFSYSSEQYKNGSQSLKLVANNASTSGGGGVILSSVRTDVKKNWIPVAPGQIYYFDIMYYAVPNARSNAVSLVLAFTDINGASYSIAAGTTSSITKGSWQRLKGSYTIPNNVLSYGEPINMIPAFQISGTVAAGDTYYIDRAIIYR